jgi:hypothetical protein
MGWSCGAAASNVLKAWSDKCAVNSGMSNVWSAGGKKYFFETSRTEHNDGAITGKIMKQVSEEQPDGSYFAKSVGSFRIEGDGTITRAPKFLKDVKVNHDNLRYAIGLGGSY